MFLIKKKGDRTHKICDNLVGTTRRACIKKKTNTTEPKIKPSTSSDQSLPARRLWIINKKEGRTLGSKKLPRICQEDHRNSYQP